MTIDNKYFYILLGLVVLLLGTTVYLYHRTTVLDSQIETIGSYVQDRILCKCYTNDELSVQQFKEDSYIRQQAHDTDVLLVMFPTFLTIFGLLTFAGVKREFQTHIAEVNKKQERYEADNKNHREQFRDFVEETKGAFGWETYLSRMIESERAELNGNKPMSIMLHLSALTYLASVYFYHLHRKPEQAPKTLQTLLSKLDELSDVKIGNQQVTMTGIRKETIDIGYQSLLKLDNDQIADKLWKIQLKLKYE